MPRVTGPHGSDSRRAGPVDGPWGRLSLGLLAAVVGALITMGLHPAVTVTATDERPAGDSSDPLRSVEGDAGLDTLVLTGRAFDPSVPAAGSDPAGACPVVVLERLRYVFRWHLDFPDDLQPGDSFRAVLLAPRSGGEGDPGDLTLLGAEIETGGHPTRAISYADSDRGTRHFFGPDGTPVGASRIPTPDGFRMTSRFDRGRFHPVLREKRPHLGVDYAVPRGEVVRAVAAGRVISVERDPALGLVVQIRHDAHRSTRYAHLSSVESGVEPGRSVSAGQPVGRAGATGIATAPHLHFELLFDGEQRNPLAQRSGWLLPGGPSIDPSAFASRRDRIVRLLESRPATAGWLARWRNGGSRRTGPTATTAERVLASWELAPRLSPEPGRRSLPRWPVPGPSGDDQRRGTPAVEEGASRRSSSSAGISCSLVRSADAGGPAGVHLMSARADGPTDTDLPVWQSGGSDRGSR